MRNSKLGSIRWRAVFCKYSSYVIIKLTLVKNGIMSKQNLSFRKNICESVKLSQRHKKGFFNYLSFFFQQYYHERHMKLMTIASKSQHI